MRAEETRGRGAAARQRVLRESQRGDHQVRAETLESAEYVLVFTTLAAAAAPAVLELYRAGAGRSSWP